LIVETGPAEFPIHHFYAQGSFVQERRAALLAETNSHPELKEPEFLEALQTSGAKFGPENKESFIKSVPTDVIYKFSACRLDLKTTIFSAESFAWVIQGTWQSTRKYPCTATFEPFDGNCWASTKCRRMAA